MSDTNNQPYSTAFSSVPRQRALAIWSTHQVVIAFGIILLFGLGLLGGHGPISIPNVIMAIIFVANLLVVRGLSVWQLAGIRLGFLTLQATGRAKATISPLTVDTTVGLLDIPGNDGRTVSLYHIINTQFERGACFIWDETSDEATAVLHLRGLSAQLQSSGHLNTLSTKFSAALASLADKPDVMRITIQSRALKKPLEPTVTPASEQSLAVQDIDYVETRMAPIAMENDYILTITVNPKKAKGDYEATTKLSAVSKLLSDRVIEINAAMQAAGVKPDSSTWLNMQQLRGLMKTLIDITAYKLLDKEGRLPDDVPLAMSWHAHSTYMEVGQVCARTRWVDHWPKEPVPIGWIQKISASTSVQLIFTQVFRARGESMAKNQVERQLNETETMKTFTSRLGRQEDRKTDDEIAALDRHLHDIGKDRGDVQFQGFLTVLAANKQQLDNDCRAVDANVNSLIHLDPLINQQLARFNGAWPLGLEGRQG